MKIIVDRSQCRRASLQITTAALCLASSLQAVAAPQPPSAPGTANGSYTVTSYGCVASSGSCMAHWLEERAGSGSAWTAVNTTTFTNKAPGSYMYRTVELHCDAYGACFSQFSSAITVTVVAGSGTPPVALEEQLQYRYRVRQGNVVGDSRTDLLIERLPGSTAGSGTLDAVMLQQVGAGSFQAVVPNASQRNTSAWQTSNLSVVVEDMNADGYADVAVRNIAAVIPGAEDQIVFAPGSPWGTSPLGVRAIDASLRRFSGDIVDYMTNNNHFVDNAPLKVEIVHVPYPYCPYGTYGDYGDPYSCFPILVPIYYVSPDFSSFDDDAVGIWRDEAAIAEGDLPAATGVERIAGRIEDLIGVEVGGWDMDEVFGDDAGIEDQLERRGLEAFLAIIGIRNAHADEGDAAVAPRTEDVVYIVGRYIFGKGNDKLHTALLYKMPITGVPTWYSGFDSEDGWFDDGTLVARTNDLKDSPPLMRFTLGEARPPGGESNFSYFFVNLLSAHDHYRGLPDSAKAAYDAIPEIPCPGCNGRNSNGYVNGLIRATQGSAVAYNSLDFTDIVGWEFPVERHYFGR